MLLVRADFLGTFSHPLEVGLLGAIRGSHQHLQVLPFQIGLLLLNSMVGELVELLQGPFAISTADQSLDLRRVEGRCL